MSSTQTMSCALTVRGTAHLPFVAKRFERCIAGADSLRLYEMFMGPLRETKVWSTRSVDGVHRFLGRVWRLYEAHASSSADATPTEEQLRVLHATIKRVTGARRCVTRRRAVLIMHARLQLTRKKCDSTPQFLP